MEIKQIFFLNATYPIVCMLNMFSRKQSKVHDTAGSVFTQGWGQAQ